MMSEIDKYESIQKAQKEIGAFANAFLTAKEQNPVVSSGAILDSLTTATDNYMPVVALPEAVQKMIDIIPDNDIKKQQTQAILDGLQLGVQLYTDAMGGDKPSDGIIASAVTGVANMLDSLNLSAMSHTHLAQVPNLTLVTISNRIANAIPLVAMLPNPVGSNSLPLMNVRFVAQNARGHYKKGDYIDGDKSNLQFIESAFEFETKTADQTTFTVTPRLTYQDGTQKPDDNAKVLPFVAGGVSVFVNGVLVATDGDPINAKSKGTNNLIGVDDDFFVKDTGGSRVKVEFESGKANLETHEISIKFKNALPDTAKVTVEVFADYERRDENNTPLITEPSLDIDTEPKVIHAHSIRSSIKVSPEALSQMQNELGVDPRSAFVGIATGKLMLEQNVKLLSRAKAIANGVENVFIADIARGVGGIAGVANYNNTRDMAVEILPTIDMAIKHINSMTNHSANGYDIYLSGNMAVFMNSLPDDSRYVPTNNAIGALNQIVKIGTLKGSINVYCIPESPDNPVFTTGTTRDPNTQKEVPYGEFLIVARNSEASKSVFVGFDAMPMKTDEYTAEAFTKGVEMVGRQCRTVNPLGKYGKQVALVKVLNMPVSLVGKV